MNKLESKRRSLGIPIRKMAELMGCHSNTYFRKEKENRFDVSEINKICNILDCRFDDIFLEETSSEKETK